MCTVSYIAQRNRIIITSNRDEFTSRAMPKGVSSSTSNGLDIYYPKDPKAGGTWYSVKTDQTAVVLLNGAFELHKRKPKYRKSRGLVVLEFINSSDPIVLLHAIDLEDIGPFTLIIFHEKQLIELRWDAHKKHISNLDASKSYIWSSSTLYNKKHRANRKKLFDDFLNHNPHPSSDDVLDFHLNNHNDFENGFVIKRALGLQTLSVTQTIFSKKDITLSYNNLIENKVYNKTKSLVNATLH